MAAATSAPHVAQRLVVLEISMDQRVGPEFGERRSCRRLRFWGGALLVAVGVSAACAGVAAIAEGVNTVLTQDGRFASEVPLVGAAVGTLVVLIPAAAARPNQD